MTLPLTPQVLAAAYDYLRATAPFKSWKLPESDAVEFSVTRHRDRSADHTTYCRSTDHIIRVSAYYTKTTADLMECIAHEMIHAHQVRIKTETKQEHNTAFARLNRAVARIHGWPVETFVTGKRKGK
jgi:hypothetical protein